MLKEYILRYAIYVIGIVAFAAFIIVKNEDLLEWATEGADKYGDLYRLALVSDFKMEIPEVVTAEEASSEEWHDQRIVFIGDSFSETERGHKRLPELVAGAVDEPLFYVKGNYFPEYFNPLYLFREKHIRRDKNRIVILERVERYIVSTYGQELDADPDLATATEESQSFFTSFADQWFTHSEQNYQYLLQSSCVTMPVIEVWNTMLFHLSGRISEETPSYSLHPPFLFYYDEIVRDSTSSFYYPHPDTLIDAIADNILALHDELASQYNAELIFMPVPTKYTLYHALVSHDRYDLFLPRLCAALKRRGVNTVELYERFAAERDTIYFPTDSHWNARGAALALEQTMNTLNELNNN